ncbi:hypothetical protein C8R47DRAFT_1132679 [Mycena vitilis]|nr:hypothetical protein C8R47DRAFT_1132679 [Mycena vitilis]
MDITEGVWDWDMRGSPQCGASEKYNFPTLGLPAIQWFELVVADLTIRDPRAGPLNIVDCTLLTHLSLDIRQCIMVYFVGNIKLFEGLSGAQFPMLSHLEIKDGNYMANSARLNWQSKGTENREDPDSEDSNFEGSEHSGVSKDWDHSEEGRYFAGLVPLFLPSLDTLVSLWLEESALLPGIETREGTGCYRFPSVRDLWDCDDEHLGTIDWAAWKAALQAFLPQLESLRVGFGVINAEDVGLILSCCNPTKLKQFGFTWAWKEYDRDAPISPELLEHLARFPRLTDVHILFPRPETQVSGTPDPVMDPLTLVDVLSIFGCNRSICRVGMGNSVVWERHALGGEVPGVLLVSDGSFAPNHAMPRFYHAGYLAKYNSENEPDWRHDGDNTTPMRPKRGKEIGQLRDLLKRILE